jgi:hypothetical protein
MMLVAKCPECGFESAQIRCPRCNALKLSGCDGVCSACASSCAKDPVAVPCDANTAKDEPLESEHAGSR